MATVRIKLSQAAADALHASYGGLALDTDLGVLVDRFAANAADFGGAQLKYASHSLSGTSLGVKFQGGASQTYKGVKGNPEAASGAISASASELLVPGVLSFGMAGQLNYDYTTGAQGLSLTPSAQASTVSSMRIATDLTASSPGYDPLVGNVTLEVKGVLSLASGSLDGLITSITASSDKAVKSSVIDGSFNVAVDLNAAAEGLLHSMADGTLTAYRTTFHDGSYFNVTGLQAWIGATDTIGDALFGGSDGKDDISIEMPARLPGDVLMASGGGNDTMSLAGGGGRLHADAGAGDDVVALLGSGHRVDGGTGHDTVRFASRYADAKVTAGAGAALSVREKSGDISELVNVERIVFSDATLALDIDGRAGQAYRLYQAAFNRTPDSGGLGYWIAAMDKGASLDSVAQNFIDSAEFRKEYGASPTSLQLVTRFYENILHRKPEANGLAFWSKALDSKAATVAGVLAGLSESAENKAALIGVIGNGFSFTPFEDG